MATNELYESISIFLSRSFSFYSFFIGGFVAHFIVFFCVELWLDNFLRKGQI